MYETWQFNYDDRIFSTPVINLSIVDRALESSSGAWSAAPRPSWFARRRFPGFRGTRSLGLPEFDPFWDACVKAGIPVSMHASDSGYSSYLNDWEPGDEFKPFSPTAFRMVAMGKRPIEDTMAAMVCHGALTRNPDLRILSVEYGVLGAIPVLSVQGRVHEDAGMVSRRTRIEAFRRRLRRGSSGRTTSRRWPTCGIDHVIFGSDSRPPGGPRRSDQPGQRSRGAGHRRRRCAKVMGANMIDLFKVPNDNRPQTRRARARPRLTP